MNRLARLYECEKLFARNSCNDFVTVVKWRVGLTDYFMTYAEKLRDPRWQKKRLEILQRDDWTCGACGSKTKTLQVHHLIYKKIDPWEYANHCYQTLCEDCHPERQAITDKLVDALRLSLKDIPTSRLAKVAQRMIAQAMDGMEV